MTQNNKGDRLYGAMNWHRAAHYTLAVVHRQGTSAAAARRLKAACNSIGLSHATYDEAAKAAEVLSGMQAVSHVAMTMEVGQGVWSGGVRRAGPNHTERRLSPAGQRKVESIRRRNRGET